MVELAVVCAAVKLASSATTTADWKSILTDGGVEEADVDGDFGK